MLLRGVLLAVIAIILTGSGADYASLSPPERR
jgi:hypothetical protein